MIQRYRFIGRGPNDYFDTIESSNGEWVKWEDVSRSSTKLLWLVKNLVDSKDKNFTIASGLLNLGADVGVLGKTKEATVEDNS